MANVIVNTVRELLSNGHDALAIIAAVLNETGHNVTFPKGFANANKQDKRNRNANKKAKMAELIKRADEEYPEWGMDGDYKYVTAKALSDAIESGEKPSRKPLSGYMMFLHEKRPELKDEGLNGRDIAKKAGAMWRELSDDDKNKYTNMGIQAIVDKYGEQPNMPAITMVQTKVTNDDNSGTSDDDTSDDDTNDTDNVGGGGSKTDDKPVKTKKTVAKKKKVAKKKPMKKAELKEHLSSKYGWDIKALSKCTVAELRVADETGELPKKAEKAVQKVANKVDNKPVIQRKDTPPRGTLGMFDSDDSDSESDSDSEE